jgi:hypothetical protein
MRELHTEIVIAAPAERVWQILTDFDAYPRWNPFIRRIDGAAVVGARLDVRIEPPGGAGMTFRPTVLGAEANRELRWLGQLGLPKLFDGEHSLTIESLAEGGVRFIQREVFSGLLVPLVGGTLAKTREGFEQMNRALKARAEQRG